MRMQREHIRHLVIDIRANSGGDDVMWLDGLMPYLATAHYRTGSSAVKRVLRAVDLLVERAVYQRDAGLRLCHAGRHGGAARRSQSGGVYGVPLPQSGLTLWIPRFVLDPPGGAPKGALLSAQAPWNPRAAPACQAL